MTTVACDRDLEEMAADSRLTDGDTNANARKLWKVNGHLIGVAGDYPAAVAFVNWYKSKTKPNVPDMKNLNVMVLTPTGKILHYDHSLHPYEVTDNFSAIGSGAQAALGAMHAGARPRDAVRIASKIDRNTGGRIHVRKL